AIFLLLISYPLWSWRRLEAAITYLGHEFLRLDREPHLLPEPVPPRTHERGDILNQRIAAMERAAHRVRDLRQFVSDSLDSLPDATLVTTLDGRIVLLNRAAAEYGSKRGLGELRGTSIFHLLDKLQNAKPLKQSNALSFQWDELFDLYRAFIYAAGVSAQDAQGRDLLVKSAPGHSSSGQLIGWIVSLIDISTI